MLTFCTLQEKVFGKIRQKRELCGSLTTEKKISTQNFYHTPNYVEFYSDKDKTQGHGFK